MVDCFNYLFVLIQKTVNYYFNTLILVPDIHLSMGDTIIYFAIIESILFIVLHRFGVIGSRGGVKRVSSNQITNMNDNRIYNDNSTRISH